MPVRKRSYLIILIIVLYSAAILPVAYLALLLLLHGITTGGRFFAIGTVLLLSVPILFAGRILCPKLTPKYLVAGVLLGGIAAYGICYILSPPGYNPSEAQIHSRYSSPAKYHRASIANLVPEIDQLLLGSYLLPGLDPYIDNEKAERIRRVFLNVYRPMRKSLGFRRLGSVLGQTYRDILFTAPVGTHFYEYIPENNTNSPLPVIMFIHGSLGNFKGYLWILKSLADKKGFAVVAPTFGVGNWNKTGGINHIEQMQKYCVDHPTFDGNQIYLAGLSNGGIGALRAARNNPDAYNGLILISAVIDPAILQKRDFIRGWRNRPVLVIHGLKDLRIPASHIKMCETVMKKNQIPVTSCYYPDQDHFLLFAEDKKVINDIKEWLPR